MRSTKQHLPSVVTALNLFAGFLSVVHSIQGDFSTAAWLIVVASVMDVLDGKVARLTKSSSEFGVELDSLADVSSFGFAPSILIYKAYFFQWGSAGVLLSFMPLLFGGIRLARFNVGVADPNEKDTFFRGLPIPSSAITLAAFVVFELAVFNTFLHIEVMTFLTVLVSFLMVSRIRYEGMPTFSLRKGTAEDKLKMAVLGAGVLGMLIYPSRVAFPVMMTFLLTGILRGIIDHFRHRQDEDEIQDIPVVD